ncbi:hypothetical protein [Burkholderia ambifaria]|uniref:hypothetical protein n=1 Tax=Burkholderia ambifaria TaxID=152480 RepID=UPI00158EED2C|nr:hypothetical protein [Burkholderia ambifaria]UEP49932.1 hypothetical protein LMA00_23260 [Burkholderia ambifaria]
MTSVPERENRKRGCDGLSESRHSMQIETFIVICNRVFPLLKPESYSVSGISDRKKYSPDAQTFGYLTRLIKRAIFASTPRAGAEHAGGRPPLE